MKTKGEAFNQIKEQVAKIEQKFGKAPRWIRIDNGKEFVNVEMKKWVAEKGIAIETTAPYLPSQNGVVEWLNWTVLELAGAMIIAKGLLKFLWDKAMALANYLCIWSPTGALESQMPYEAETGKKPNVSHFWEFGCDIWMLDESINRLKLDPWSKKMIFVGFMDGPKAVWYYDAKNRSIKISRNVAFNEDKETKALDIMEVPGIQEVF